MVTGYDELRMVFDLLLAILLGSLIGLERTHLHKIAGLRTYALVSMGSCLFTLVSIYSFKSPIIAAGVVTGIGFLGAGIIIHHGAKVEGITTAAALWTTASIGVAVATELYILSIASAVLILVVLGLFRVFNVEEKVDELFFKDSKKT